MTVSSLIGRKVGMTSVFESAGVMTGVTVLEIAPNRVVARRTQDRDGYEAAVLGFGDRRDSRARKPQLGQAKAAGLEADSEIIREAALKAGTDAASLELGAEIGVADVFSAGDWIDIIGTSRGHGFSGTRKRHHFSLGPASHGSKNYREPGSTGHSTSPGKVFKGKRMAGHKGNKRATVRNLRVVAVDAEKNLLLVAGSVPGWKTGAVVVRHAIAKYLPKQAN